MGWRKSLKRDINKRTVQLIMTASYLVDEELAQFGWPESSVLNAINPFGNVKGEAKLEKSKSLNLLDMDINETICLFLFLFICFYCILEELVEIIFPNFNINFLFKAISA